MRIEEFVQATQCIAEEQTVSIALLGNALGYIKAKLQNISVKGLGKDSSGLIQIIDEQGNYWYIGVTEILAVKVYASDLSPSKGNDRRTS